MPEFILIQGTGAIVDHMLTDRTRPIDTEVGNLSFNLAIEMRYLAPKRTGKLARGIKSKRAYPMTYEIGETEWYGEIQRLGTIKKNYPIMPRNRMALWWPGLEHPIPWVKSHPGIKGDPYNENAVRNRMAWIEQTANNIGAIFTMRRGR